MERWFSEHGISMRQFVEISAIFLMVMLCFLERRIYEERKWIHHLLFGVLIAHWVLALVFEPLQTKIFASLMVLSVIVVETVIKQQRKSAV